MLHTYNDRELVLVPLIIILLLFQIIFSVRVGEKVFVSSIALTDLVHLVHFLPNVGVATSVTTEVQGPGEVEDSLVWSLELL